MFMFILQGQVQHLVSEKVQANESLLKSLNILKILNFKGNKPLNWFLTLNGNYYQLGQFFNETQIFLEIVNSFLTLIYLILTSLDGFCSPIASNCKNMVVK